MIRAWGLAVLFVTSVAAAGCGGMRYYAQPPEAEPHARVVIRFDHSARTDTGPLDEFIWINGDPIELRVDEDHALRVRVTPGPTHWVFKSMRYHEEDYVIDHRTEYRTSTGGYSHTTHHYMPVTDHVGEAGCTTRWAQSMDPRDVYFFEYRYASPDDCSVTCTHGADHAPCDGVIDTPPETPPR